MSPTFFGNINMPTDWLIFQFIVLESHVEIQFQLHEFALFAIPIVTWLRSSFPMVYRNLMKWKTSFLNHSVETKCRWLWSKRLCMLSCSSEFSSSLVRLWGDLIFYYDVKHLFHCQPNLRFVTSLWCSTCQVLRLVIRQFSKRSLVFLR